MELIITGKEKTFVQSIVGVRFGVVISVIISTMVNVNVKSVEKYSNLSIRKQRKMVLAVEEKFVVVRLVPQNIAGEREAKKILIVVK